MGPLGKPYRRLLQETVLSLLSALNFQSIPPPTHLAFVALAGPLFKNASLAGERCPQRACPYSPLTESKPPQGCQQFRKVFLRRSLLQPPASSLQPPACNATRGNTTVYETSSELGTGPEKRQRKQKFTKPPAGPGLGRALGAAKSRQDHRTRAWY